jgi:hypothetical protein
VVLLLDSSLLLAHPPDKIRPLLEQLRSLKQLMPPRAQVHACMSKTDLPAAAECHLGDAGLDYLAALTGTNPALCQLLDTGYESKSKQPARMLRNAHKVSNAEQE